MADDGKNQPSLLPISGILALIALIGVTIFTQEPLKGKRPGIEKIESFTGKVDARLWQDPFQAVMESKSLGPVHAEIPGEFQSCATILAVMVPGAPYAEESELRLRWRYAVLAGLRRVGYVPDNAEHINYVVYPQRQGRVMPSQCPTTETAKIGMEDIVPFERLTKYDHSKAVLLVWINEESLEGTPSLLKNLDVLLKNIGIHKDKESKIIGPSSSTHLLRMVQEISDGNWSPGRNLDIYSATATMETYFLKKWGTSKSRAKDTCDKKITPGANGNSPGQGNVELSTNISDKSIAFKGKEIIKRTIKPDDVLAALLAAELDKRNCLTGVGPFSSGNGTIALIFEWDTQYGRLLPLTVEDRLRINISPDFTLDEFKRSGIEIENLCSDTHELRCQGLTAPPEHNDEVKLKWLNQLLKDNSLPEKMKKLFCMIAGNKIQKITERFENEQYGIYTMVSADEKPQAWKWLNRLLLEDIFKEDIPKNNTFLHFSYLRGIDGMVPGEDQKKNDAPEKKDKKDIQEMFPSGMPEQPAGKSQYDYLRRLAEKIYQTDRKLKLQGERGITAIGVLGTDFYDKYLVLQAVRQRLPQCVYFTTELDARYLQADNNKWTKNLVVASHFGFELEGKKDIGKNENRQTPDIQKDMPPFRDSYQTSLFYAVLNAFPKELKDYELKDIDTEPHIYEIGRRNAVELEAGNRYIKSFFDVHRTRIYVLVLFGFALLYVSSLTVREFMLKNWFVILAIALFIVLIIILLPRYLSEEPLSFFEGLSIWPTEILRLLAAMFSVAFVWYAHHSCKKDCSKITQFFLSAAVGKKEDKAKETACLRCGLARFRKTAAAIGEGDRKAMFSDIWHKYVEYGKFRYRMLRVVTAAVFFLIFCGTLLAVFGRPSMPGRGRLTFLADSWILICSICSFIFLTFFVVDTSRLCAEFIRAVSSAMSKRTPSFLSCTITKQLPVEDTGNKQGPDNDNKCTGKQDKIYDEQLLVDIVARHTTVIEKFIIYPVTVWIVLVISRSSFFDNWQTPLSLLVVISFSAIYAWSCAFRLRKAAERLRGAALSYFQGKKEEFVLIGDKARVEVIERCLKEISGIQTGAFSPILSHPLLKSALVAAGGLGGTALLQFLDFFNM